MLLHELILKDVGPYKGEHTLTFSTDPERPITMIGGHNGAGKTTLLESLRLALYGPRAKDLYRGGAYPDYLKRLINRGADAAVGSSVTLAFSRVEDAANAVYRITRKWRVTGAGNIVEDFEVLHDDKPREDMSTNWADHVEQMIPLALSDLAFFDGERISALAEADRTATTLKSAIEGLLGVDLIRQVDTDLDTVIRRKAADADHTAHAELEQFDADIETIEAGLSSMVADLGDCQSRVDRAERARAKAEDLLAAAGGKVHAEMATHEERLVLARHERDVAAAKLRVLADGELPLLMLLGQVQRIVESGSTAVSVQVAEAVHETLMERDEQLARELASSGTGPEVVAHLLAWLERDRAARTPEVDDATVLYDQNTVGQALRVVDASPDLFDAINELTASVTAGEDAVSQVEALIDASPEEEDIRAKFERLGKLKAELEAETATRDKLQTQIDEAERALDRLVEQRRRAAVAAVEAEFSATTAARIVREAARAKLTLKKFGDAIVAHHVGRISGFITEALGSLLHKDDLVAKVDIDPDTYEMSLYSPDGGLIDAADLSAGESQMVAVAVLWGLSAASGRLMPTVVDTPLGRLDSGHREKVVKNYFPHASHQTVLLSTDQEVVGELYAALKPHIGVEHTLSWDPEQTASAITSGYAA